MMTANGGDFLAGSSKFGIHGHFFENSPFYSGGFYDVFTNLFILQVLPAAMNLIPGSFVRVTPTVHLTSSLIVELP